MHHARHILLNQAPADQDKKDFLASSSDNLAPLMTLDVCQTGRMHEIVIPRFLESSLDSFHGFPTCRDRQGAPLRFPARYPADILATRWRRV